jgi:hypothetical protein
MTFWLGVVLVLLPNVDSQLVPKSQVSTSDVLVAASDIVADIQHFCERQPQACVVGSQTTATLGERAQTGAKILYDFLRDQFGSSDSTSMRTTGGIPIPPARPSQHEQNMIARELRRNYCGSMRRARAKGAGPLPIGCGGCRRSRARRLKPQYTTHSPLCLCAVSG